MAELLCQVECQGTQKLCTLSERNTDTSSLWHWLMHVPCAVSLLLLWHSEQKVALW